MIWAIPESFTVLSYNVWPPQVLLDSKLHSAPSPETTCKEPWSQVLSQHSLAWCKKHVRNTLRSNASLSCWNLTFHIPHIPRRTKTGGLTISEGIFIMHWIRLNILFCFWKWWRGNAVPSDKKSLLGQQNSSIFDQLQFTCDSNLFIYESQKWMQHSSMKQFTYVLHASHKSPALNKAMRMVGIITKPNYYFCITQVDQSHPREQTNKQTKTSWFSCCTVLVPVWLHHLRPTV